jgi:hypothetical protein
MREVQGYVSVGQCGPEALRLRLIAGYLQGVEREYRSRECVQVNSIASRKSREDLKVGDTLWVPDSNRRRYVDDNGAKSRDANPWKYWRPCKVTGETSRSWEIDGGKSSWKGWLLAKKGEIKTPPNCGQPAYSVAEIEERRTLNMGAHTIARAWDDANTETRLAVLALLGIPPIIAPPGAIDHE